MSNPYLTILVVVIVVLVGKELFLKKEEKSKIEKDVSAVSSKTDSGLSIIRQEFTGALHNHELKNKDEFAVNLDKTRKEINEIWDKIDQKYVSKELNKQYEERLRKQEETSIEIRKELSEIRADVSEMKPYLEKIDMLYDMMKEFVNKK